MQNPKRFLGTCGVPYEARRNSCGYTSIEVLPFLKGKPWDRIALGFVHALRPSKIRVTQGEVTCDARMWRVTVTVDDSNVIKEITQEVEVALPNGIANGGTLERIAKGKCG